MKVATIVGTRPEIIRLSRVMTALDRCVEHVMVHTGQNFDKKLSDIFFDDLKIRKPDYFFKVKGLAEMTTLSAAGVDTRNVPEPMEECQQQDPNIEV